MWLNYIQQGHLKEVGVKYWNNINSALAINLHSRKFRTSAVYFYSKEIFWIVVWNFLWPRTPVKTQDFIVEQHFELCNILMSDTDMFIMVSFFICFSKDIISIIFLSYTFSRSNFPTSLSIHKQCTICLFIITRRYDDIRAFWSIWIHPQPRCCQKYPLNFSLEWLNLNYWEVIRYKAHCC